jgi:hypothetical protein
MTRLIAVFGSSPGVGKSTECERLHRELVAEGLRVDRFAEEEIRTRASFEPVWRSFEQAGAVPPELFLSCTEDYVKWLLTEGYDVAVTDALIPYTPSLFGFGLGEAAVAEFLVALREVLAPVDFELRYVDGDPEVALRRAASREGAGWLAWFVAKVAGYAGRPDVHDLASAADYLRVERDLTLRLLRDAGFPVRVLHR